MRLSVVVLPQPEGPSSESSSPSCTIRSRPATAWTPPKSRAQPRSSTTARAISTASSPASSMMEEDRAEIEEAVGEPDHEERPQDEQGGQRRDARVRVVHDVGEHG